MPTAFLTKVQGKQPGLIAYGDDDIEVLGALRPGKRYRAKIVLDRSLPYHRLMFRVFRLLAEVLNAGPVGVTFDEGRVRRELLVVLGYAERRVATISERSAYGLPARGAIDHLMEAIASVIEGVERLPILGSLPWLSKRLDGLKRALEAVGPLGECYVIVPQSMAFERMDQREAHRFFEEALAYILREFAWAEGHPAWGALLETVGMMAPAPEEVQ